MTCQQCLSCMSCLVQNVAQLTGLQSKNAYTLLLTQLSGIAKLHLLQGAVLVSPTTALSQVFNVSHNNLTGSVPSFLASSKVPSYTKQGISLVVMLSATSCFAFHVAYWL